MEGGRHVLVVSACVILLYSRILYSAGNTGHLVKIYHTGSDFGVGRRCALPEHFDVIIRGSGLSIPLTLTRNRHTDTDTQVSVMDRSDSGQPVLQTIVQDKSRHTQWAYQDLIQGAAVLLRCRKVFKGVLLEIDGFVTFNDQIYKLNAVTDGKRLDNSQENIPHELRPALPGSLHPLKHGSQPSSVESGSSHIRRKRATADYFVDVLVVTDFAIYKQWYDRSTATTPDLKKKDAIDNIRRYFALIMNGVNLRYKTITENYTITVRVVEIMIMTTKKLSTWTEDSKIGGRVNANYSLYSFKSWIATPSNNLAQNDHAMLFTGYDIYSKDNGNMFQYTSGKAFVGTLCRKEGWSVSIVEDHGGFQSVHAAAHELGHSMDAGHDGSSNTCSSRDRYIMSGKPFNATDVTKFNPWIFSPCSSEEIRKFIAKKLKTEDGKACLLNKLPSTQVPNVSDIVPGQTYLPDAQCRHIYGNGSYYCRGPQFSQESAICTSMFCRDPKTPASCVERHGVRGTSCGNKMWCESGRCVFSPDAPTRDENCIHGDHVNARINDEPCHTAIKTRPFICYQREVRAVCCGTCKDTFKEPGCEYGDKTDGCVSRNCNSIYSDGTLYDTNCCKTCNYNTRTWQCIDRTTSPAITCSRIQSYHCYNTTLAYHCCATCKKHRDVSIKQCEYGDYNPIQCPAMTNNEKSCSDSALTATCCKTCAQTTSSARSDRIGSMFGLLIWLLYVMNFYFCTNFLSYL